MNQRWWYGVLAVFLALLAAGAGLAIARSNGADVPVIGSGEPGPFRGRYTTGFEVSSFVPCDKPDVKYWLTWERPIDLSSRLPAAPTPAGPARYRTAFLEIEGDLDTTSRNGFGHLGQYDGELTITRILKVAPDRECD